MQTADRLVTHIGQHAQEDAAYRNVRNGPTAACGTGDDNDPYVPLYITLQACLTTQQLPGEEERTGHPHQGPPQLLGPRGDDTCQKVGWGLLWQ